MSTSLSQKIQESIGLPPLHKIDPSNQDTNTTLISSDITRLGQSCIPVCLIALYKLSKTPEGSECILRGDNSTNWVNILLGDKKTEIIQRIAVYANYQNALIEEKLNEICSKAVHYTQHELNADKKLEQISDRMLVERNTILQYLPPELKIGELIDDSTLDDKTNKMEGPISTLMHKIESGFSTPH